MHHYGIATVHCLLKAEPVVWTPTRVWILPVLDILNLTYNNLTSSSFSANFTYLRGDEKNIHSLPVVCNNTYNTYIHTYIHIYMYIHMQEGMNCLCMNQSLQIILTSSLWSSNAMLCGEEEMPFALLWRLEGYRSTVAMNVCLYCNLICWCWDYWPPLQAPQLTVINLKPLNVL